MSCPCQADYDSFKRLIPKDSGVSCNVILRPKGAYFRWRNGLRDGNNDELQELIVEWARRVLFPLWTTTRVGDVRTFVTEADGLNGVVMSCKKDSIGWSVIIQNAHNPLGLD